MDMRELMKKLSLVFVFVTVIFCIPAQLFAATNISAASSHSAAILEDGTLWTWGNNTYGQLGDGGYVSKENPVQVGSDTNWSSVSACSFTVAIKNDGTLWAWGYGGTTNIPVQIGADTNWSFVSADIGIKSNGTLWDWQNGGTGIPMQIGADTNWSFVSACGHNMAIKTNGTLWAWGGNDYGQLGDGTRIYRNTPVQIGADTWSYVSAGDSRTIGIKTNGTIWGWGENYYEDWLGIGTNMSDQLTPAQIGYDNDWLSVSAGFKQQLAIKTDGTLWVWGYNRYGQLGDGTTIDKVAGPEQIGTNNDWAFVAAGYEYTLAINNIGTLFVWGSNLDSQLGDGTISDKNSPTQAAMAFT